MVMLVMLALLGHYHFIEEFTGTSYLLCIFSFSVFSRNNIIEVV